MKTKKEIKARMVELKEYEKHADTRFDCTQKELYQEAINALLWVLDQGEIDEEE